MAQAKKGDRVTINFIGTLEDGTVFDTTFPDPEAACSTDDCGLDDCGCCDESGPMELVIGEDDFFTQIEEALVGMAPGEKKTVKIPAEDAFGEYDEDKVFTVPRSEIPDDIYPEVGQELELTGEDDEVIEVTVVEVDDEHITLDANHPLAGEDLSYEVELYEIL
ncbi:MAG: peptidylprolyl isomerase [Trichloromonas sp.]|jgi:peptidylprolyl isomerase|nr:peptidylprolyl isomerase [Trichloromonas sp.]